MILDIIFLIILLYFTHKGYKRGAIVTFVTAIASILGVLVAITFSSTVANMLFDTSDNLLFKKAIPILSYLLVFFGTVYLVRMLATFLKKIIKGLGLGIVDRLIGAVISAFAILVVGSLSFWVLTKLGIFTTSIQETSKSYQILYQWAPSVLAFFQSIFPFMKSTFADLKSYFELLNDSVSEHVDTH